MSESFSQDTPDSRKPARRPSVALIVCAGIALGVFLKLFVVDFLHVSGRSMVPSIRDGETIVVSKLRYGIVMPYGDKLLLRWSEPCRGDVVIYLYENKQVVKRCVAVGGDSLSVSRSADNDLFGEFGYTLEVCGSRIPLNETQFKNLSGVSSVPEGYVLAVGDNYGESLDSRNYGFVPVYNILGKVLCK